jgi:hypothetical protein
MGSQVAPMDGWISAREASRILGISVGAFINTVAKKNALRVRVIKGLPNRPRYYREEVEALIEDQESVTTEGK